MRRRPPGRAAAAAGTAARAIVLNVMGTAVAGAVAATVVIVLATRHPGVSGFAWALGLLFGLVLGTVAGGVHAAVQVVVMLVTPAHRRRPVSPVVAVLTSAVLAAVLLGIVTSDESTDTAERNAYAYGATIYVVGTWPLANALLPPGRPRRRVPDDRGVPRD